MKNDPLKKIISSAQVEPFIRKIVFSNFKNISPMQELIFDYPITALIGQNGTNKTSALIALYGAVEKKRPSEYWFTTSLDKTKEDKYQSYWYTYRDHDTGETAEVFQHNNQRMDPRLKFKEDYWETDRPQLNYGMSPLSTAPSENKTKTRWKKIKKEVIYINFRSELSAFDKCLYHSIMPSKYYQTKQAYIRKQSKNLKISIENNSQTFKFRNREKIIENVMLDSDSVSIISNILNKNYKTIKYIEHTFFSSIGGTAFLETEDLNYSEAYAGSGEFAVISLVHKVMKAAPNSLILLDEPEVSLHPNAQKKLIEFLYEKTKTAHHQVVMSTHSPEIVKRLPDEAIKLFYEDPITHRIHIDNTVHKYNAFSNIGYDFDKVPIYVEDKLAKAIVEKAIKETNLFDLFEVTFFPGGADAIITRLNHFIEAGNKQIVLLDGDKKTNEYIKNNGFPDEKDIPDSALEKTIKSLFGFEVKFITDGKNGVSASGQKVAQQRNFLKNTKRFVSYLPFETPEIFILQEQQKPLCGPDTDSEQAKEIFETLTKEDIGSSCSDSIYFTQLRYLNKIPNDNRKLKDVCDMLESMKKFIVSV
ncbi:TPA: ATP-dependent nuclease [Pasteurella multocida]